MSFNSSCMSPCRSDYIFTDKHIGVWHVVSEDSDHFGAWFAVVHRLRDFYDLEQPTVSEMRVRFHQSHTFHELLEIKFLGSSQRVLLEKWNNRPKKITPFRNDEHIQIFFVIVQSTIYVDAANTKEVLEHVETADALRALCHHKLMRHLEACSVPSAICSLRLSHDVDRKASFTVNETDYPADLDQSFLLIVRS
jgi:hypothetical protein